MRKTTLSLMLALAPAALVAQASGQATGQATSTTTAKAQRPAATVAAQASANSEVSLKAPKGWSAEGSAKLEAMYQDAKSKDLPPEPMAKRVAEGSVKGASETTILASAGKVKANMEAAHEAMVDAGRKEPSPEETSRGASAMEHGVTKAQIETMAKHTPSERSLVVAFDVLTRLTARGVPVGKALAQVQSKLDARASDDAILALSTQGGASVGIGGGSSMSGGASSNGTAGKSGGSATTGATGSTKGPGVVTGVTTAVTGVVKRP